MAGWAEPETVQAGKRGVECSAACVECSADTVVKVAVADTPKWIAHAQRTQVRTARCGIVKDRKRAARRATGIPRNSNISSGR